METDKSRFATITDSFRISQEVAGEHGKAVKRSVLFFFIAFLAEGAAFSCFYPFMKAVYGVDANQGRAFFWIGIMTLFGVVYSFARWQGHSVDFTGKLADISHSLRLKLGLKLRGMPLEKLYKYRTGELNAVFSSGVEESVLHFGVVTSLMMQVLVVPAVIITVTFFQDWRLALIMLLILPLGIPVYRWKRRSSAEEKKDVSDAHAAAESDIVEYTQGLFVLRSVNQTGKRSERLQKSFKILRDVQKKGQTKGVLPSVVIAALVQAALLAVTAAGLYFIAGGTLTLPVLAALLVIMSRFIEPLEIFASVASVIDIMNTAFQKIKAVLAVEELNVTAAEKEPSGSSVDFEDVEFAYSGESTKALNGVSFHLPSCSLTAIVGPSGSGKTTITKMLMRFADPAKGTIRIGGADIRSMTQTELMKNISVVFQDVYLFDDTVLNNIRMGRPDATDDEVRLAAEAAYCDEFITRLPEGYNTEIGDIGGNLSGGERQRISIARAILKDAPIVILDEPTAALDTESETAVQGAIDSLVKDRTVIVIAHRLSTIAGADTILVVDDGKVAERGRHEELASAGGRYTAMWNAQQRAKKWQMKVQRD